LSTRNINFYGKNWNQHGTKLGFYYANTDGKHDTHRYTKFGRFIINLWISQTYIMTLLNRFLTISSRVFTTCQIYDLKLITLKQSDLWSDFCFQAPLNFILRGNQGRGINSWTLGRPSMINFGFLFGKCEITSKQRLITLQ